MAGNNINFAPWSHYYQESSKLTSFIRDLIFSRRLMAPLYFSLTLAFVVWSLHCRAVRPMFSWEYFTLYLYCTYSAIELPPPPGNMLIFSIFCFKNGFNKFPCILLHFSRNLTWNYQIFLTNDLTISVKHWFLLSLSSFVFPGRETTVPPILCIRAKSTQSRYESRITRKWSLLYHNLVTLM